MELDLNFQFSLSKKKKKIEKSSLTSIHASENDFNPVNQGFKYI